MKLSEFRRLKTKDIKESYQWEHVNRFESIFITFLPRNQFLNALAHSFCLRHILFLSYFDGTRHEMEDFSIRTNLGPLDNLK